MVNTSVQGQGDDGFNIHGNFIMVAKQLTAVSIECVRCCPVQPGVLLLLRKR